jgi:hypothetical protein
MAIRGSYGNAVTEAALAMEAWHSAHDWKVPYPGDKRILPPSEVPGHNLPNGYLGD